MCSDVLDNTKINKNLPQSAWNFWQSKIKLASWSFCPSNVEENFFLPTAWNFSHHDGMIDIGNIGYFLGWPYQGVTLTFCITRPAGLVTLVYH